MTISCDHTYKLNCVFLWENHKNLFYNTQKLDHDGNRMWVCIPWDNTFQLVTAKFQETEAHFCKMLLCGEKMGLDT